MILENTHSIDNPVILSQTEKSVSLELFIPEESDFFCGHFPEFKLLPAVAQFEVVTRFASIFFNIGTGASKIRRMKFMAPVLPDTKVNLSISYEKEKNRVSFTMCDCSVKDKIYSTGSYEVC